MKKVDRWAALTAALLLTVSLAPASQAAEAGEKIVILHTNDVHCALDDAIGYAGLAAYAGALEEQYGADRVTLVDAGDAIQGQAVGTLSQGEYIISLMNAAGYDLAVPGNHEFDYGVDRLMELAAGAEFPYLSCNFTGLAAGEPVFQPYALLDYGDTTVGYVGICTPESLTKTDPTYFRDEAGEAVYGFRQGGDGQELYDCVQAAVDQARAEGADYVVAVGHLGNEGISAQWSSQAVIAHTTGIDVSLDGHSHEQYERTLPNREGKDVVLAQTGTGLTAIGQVILDPVTGEIQAELVAGYAGRDPEMEEEIAAVQAQYEEQLSQVVGSTDVALVTTDPATGEYWVRSRETNLGDFCADAYRAVMGADIAFVNGGGTRADLKRLPLRELRPIALSYLKNKRIPHVLGTEQEAIRLAERYGADVEKARVAALLHDCTKKLNMEEQLELCGRYGIQLDELEQKALKLLHAKTGAAIARDVFGVDDEIYNAIWWHTTGHAHMTLLEKVIYLADYIEPSRNFPGVDKLRKMCYEDLNAGLLMGLEMSIEEMTEMGNPVHHATIEARDALKG